MVLNCAAYTERGRRRGGGRGRAAGERRRRRGSWPPRRPRALRVERLRVRRPQGRALRRVRRREPGVELRPLEARRGAWPPRPPTRVTSSSARRGCSAPAARTSSTRCSGGPRARRGAGGGRPGGLPHLHRPPRPRALVRIASGQRLRHPPRARRRGPAPGTTSPRPLRAGRRGLPARADHHRGVPAAGAAPCLLACSAPSATRCCPTGRRGWTPTWPNGRCTREAARDRRGRVHRLHLRAARGAATHEVVVLDKLTYAGRRENLPRGRRCTLVVGAIEDPNVVREVMDGVDAVVNFAAESHVDRSIADQEAFARTHVIGTGVLLDAARELGVQRYLQVSTDEVYGSIASGLVHGGVAARPLLPLLGDQGRGRPARSGARPHLRHRGGDLPRLEQLRAAPVPREADPADDPERAARRLAAGVRRRAPGAQLALRRGLLPRHPQRARARPAGPGLQRRRSRRVREPRGRRAGSSSSPVPTSR